MTKKKQTKPKAKKSRRVVLNRLFINPKTENCTCREHQVARRLLRENGLYDEEGMTVSFVAEPGYQL